MHMYIYIIQACTCTKLYICIHTYTHMFKLTYVAYREKDRVSDAGHSYNINIIVRKYNVKPLFY